MRLSDIDLQLKTVMSSLVIVKPDKRRITQRRRELDKHTGESMTTTIEFVSTAALALSAQIAIGLFLYKTTGMRVVGGLGAGDQITGDRVRQARCLVLPIAILLALVGNATSVIAFVDAQSQEAAKANNVKIYAPLVKAALAAEPTSMCSSNGYLVKDRSLPGASKSCAQVGPFRVLNQYASMPGTLEVYKVMSDGSVRIAFNYDYETGYAIDETVSSLDELITEFSVDREAADRPLSRM